MKSLDRDSRGSYFTAITAENNLTDSTTTSKATPLLDNSSNRVQKELGMIPSGATIECTDVVLAGGYMPAAYTWGEKRLTGKVLRADTLI